jgi:predicted nuclease of predicted toxin-antitoxin system
VRRLIDENLSEALIPALAELFPGSLHVRLLGAGGGSDSQIWNLAREQGCVLLTRDEDFLQMSVLKGAPPKIIYLRIGNCSTAAVERLIRDRIGIIQQFEADEQTTFLALA